MYDNIQFVIHKTDIKWTSKKYNRNKVWSIRKGS